MQTDDEGNLFPKLLEEQGIVPGVKVDKGTIPLLGASGDLITQGLDGLAERLSIYKKQGARFTKWREVYEIGKSNPTHLGIQANAETVEDSSNNSKDGFGYFALFKPVFFWIRWYERT